MAKRKMRTAAQCVRDAKANIAQINRSRREENKARVALAKCFKDYCKAKGEPKKRGHLSAFARDVGKPVSTLQDYFDVALVIKATGDKTITPRKATRIARGCSNKRDAQEVKARAATARKIDKTTEKVESALEYAKRVDNMTSKLKLRIQDKDAVLLMAGICRKIADRLYEGITEAE